MQGKSTSSCKVLGTNTPIKWLDPSISNYIQLKGKRLGSRLGNCSINWQHLRDTYVTYTPLWRPVSELAGFISSGNLGAESCWFQKRGPMGTWNPMWPQLSFPTCGLHERMHKDSSSHTWCTWTWGQCILECHYDLTRHEYWIIWIIWIIWI